MFLNSSHHLKNVSDVFEKIFAKGKNVILEVHLTQDRPEWSIVGKEKLIELASKYDHKLIKEVDSDRPNRTIILFGREK